MVYGSQEERAAYVDSLKQLMKDTVEKDRAERRKNVQRDSQQTTFIGGTGTFNNLLAAVE